MLNQGKSATKIQIKNKLKFIKNCFTFFVFRAQIIKNIIQRIQIQIAKFWLKSTEILKKFQKLKSVKKLKTMQKNAKNQKLHKKSKTKTEIIHKIK